MTKKKYCPMTIEHEVLEMNQAIAAGCTYEQQGTGLICDNCWPAGSHTWTVYSNGEYGIGISNQTVWENDYSSQKPAGAVELTGECGKYEGLGFRGVQAGQAFIAKDPGRDGTWDPNGDSFHSAPDYGFSPAAGLSTRDSIVYNQNS